MEWRGSPPEKKYIKNTCFAILLKFVDIFATLLTSDTKDTRFEDLSTFTWQVFKKEINCGIGEVQADAYATNDSKYPAFYGTSTRPERLARYEVKLGRIEVT
jgi:hypothetical protein